jgi:uncharacterized protein (DUF2461 family)
VNEFNPNKFHNLDKDDKKKKKRGLNTVSPNKFVNEVQKKHVMVVLVVDEVLENSKMK